MKNNELNLIPIFVAVYEEQSLSRAATRLEISQPAVSKALSRLRDVYQDPLFNRSASGVEATGFAADIYPAMAAALQNYKSTLISSRDFAAEQSNRVFSIACLSSISYHLLPEVFANINQVAPNISLDIHPLFSEDYEADLRLGKYDLVLDLEPQGRTTLKTEVILEGTYKVCCRGEHPRIKPGELTIEQFCQEEHIAISRWHNRRHILSDLKLKPIEQRKISYSAPGILEAIPVVKLSNCLALFPTLTAIECQKIHNFQVHDLPFDIPTQKVCSIWHPSRNHDAAHLWLRDQIRNTAKHLDFS
ncbi:LysR family transcriptional regulator [Vibrio agarivorans]|uniref:LysR family transcriptional regulator n=1 Tax=Vibrio agarivorans TaxID=153622 RepID=A0ABT7Y414_9VIBR|nr:LysR family transcriptional regulator [Vibrio agarivorans]MDN2482705.1 LysR family transcriptional regulator [Vibrio agarivorans]